MPTPSEIRETVDTWLAARWATMRDRQTMYQTTHARYFQGLWTHRLLEPADGLETAPDQALVTPTDQPHRWSDLVTLPLTMPCRLRLDVYDGPLGQGFTGTVGVIIGAERWQRSQSIGPETWRTVPWHLVTAT